MIQYSYKANIIQIDLIESTYLINQENTEIQIPESNVDGFNIVLINKDLQTIYIEGSASA